MNALLLNRDGFQMPVDGWYQIAPLGEFGHAQAGLIQVVDREACEAMVNRFRDEAKGANFAGLLVDFDHFSLDGEKRSEAAGWITELEVRNAGVSHKDAEGTEGRGLFAKIRWSDVGEEAVKGGRYRFLSPVWARGDCVELGDGRVRPVRLLNAAVTNDPNLKGMRPLSNSGRDQRPETADRRPEEAEKRFEQKATKGTKSEEDGEPQMDADERRLMKNAGGVQRFKWVLGRTESGKHCPSCVAMAGQVHTMVEWEAAGMKPGAGALYCQGNCRCRLVATNEREKGELSGGPLRKRVSGLGL